MAYASMFPPAMCLGAESTGYRESSQRTLPRKQLRAFKTIEAFFGQVFYAFLLSVSHRALQIRSRFCRADLRQLALQIAGALQ